MYARGFILFAKTLAHADANRNGPANAANVAAYTALDCVKSINPPLLVHVVRVCHRCCALLFIATEF